MYNFDQCCLENNVEYFACAGTILGAVRHNKIIPWDDDLDIGIIAGIGGLAFGSPIMFLRRRKRGISLFMSIILCRIL